MPQRISQAGGNRAKVLLARLNVSSTAQYSHCIAQVCLHGIISLYDTQLSSTRHSRLIQHKTAFHETKSSFMVQPRILCIHPPPITYVFLPRHKIPFHIRIPWHQNTCHGTYSPPMTHIRAPRAHICLLWHTFTLKWHKTNKLLNSQTTGTKYSP